MYRGLGFWGLGFGGTLNPKPHPTKIRALKDDVSNDRANGTAGASGQTSRGM